MSFVWRHPQVCDVIMSDSDKEDSDPRMSGEDDEDEDDDLLDDILTLHEDILEENEEGIKEILGKSDSNLNSTSSCKTTYEPGICHVIVIYFNATVAAQYAKIILTYCLYSVILVNEDIILFHEFATDGNHLQKIMKGCWPQPHHNDAFLMHVYIGHARARVCL